MSKFEPIISENPPEKEPLVLYIPDDLLEALTLEAEKRDMSLTELVTSIIEDLAKT